MRVRIENACVWGEGRDSKRHEIGSVIEVPEEVVEKNDWMKPTDAELHEAPAPKENNKAD